MNVLIIVILVTVILVTRKFSRSTFKSLYEILLYEIKTLILQFLTIFPEGP